jgi:hypothetical protein
MLALFALLSLTPLAAASSQPGNFLPGAAPLAQGHGRAGLGAHTIYELGSDYPPDPGVQGEVEVGLTDALALNGMLAVQHTGLWMPSLGARYRVEIGPELHVAPWVGAALFAADGETNMLYGAGLAFEGGWERLRLDGTTTWMAGSYELDTGNGALIGPPFSLAASELGVSWLLNEHQRVRAGLTSILPTLSWRLEMDRWYVDAALASLGVVGIVSLQGGVIF